MNRNEAIKILHDTFDKAFDLAHYKIFIKNLLNEIDEGKAFSYSGQYIPEAFRDYVELYERIGKFTDPDGIEIDVLHVKLWKDTSLDRARTMQRNFVASYLKKRGGKDAALVAYHCDDSPDWRFSLVKMDYQTVEEGGRIKVKEALTPVRRFPFLVGENEPNHTVQQQLVSFLEHDQHSPSLGEIEKAFNIESITKEFFEKYKELFLTLKDELDALLESNAQLGKEFTARGIKTPDFAKKLLGQIVFLYFLQKKGWLGVEYHQNGKSKACGLKNSAIRAATAHLPLRGEWGTGPKDFLRKLFDKKIVPYKSFFNDILEPLFYEALATERLDSYFPRLQCRIPFLNGGLFEPIENYDWRTIDIPLSNETFERIFASFDLYNFTVREDEPLEKEIAIDPEMLGKVFENLLEVRDRNSKGAFYTPREIVHFMCQESLIHYLDTEINGVIREPLKRDITQPALWNNPSYLLNKGGHAPPFATRSESACLPSTSLRTGIPRGRSRCALQNGLQFSQQIFILPRIIEKIPIHPLKTPSKGILQRNLLKTVFLGGDLETFIRHGELVRENEMRVESAGVETKTYSYLLPESIRQNAHLLDSKLASVKICDPAIGSGAFPVGMLHEIVRAREILTTYLKNFIDRSKYALKRHAICYSIYGVPNLENEIKHLVYSVYKLKPNEIAIIEGTAKQEERS